MKQNNTIFFFLILSVFCFVNNQQVFDQVKSLLINFRADIVKEQQDADARCHRENVWIVGEINKAVALLAHRVKQVNDVKAHIAFLDNEISQTEKDIKNKQDRIAANNRLLEQFKKERCENNLLFVKNLREHLEGIQVMTLLRGDIVAYFKGSAPKSMFFLEKFDDFSHLLDDENKLVLAQLTTEIQALPSVKGLTTKTNDYSKQRDRTAAEIGVGHVDNTRGELKALATPKFEAADVYKRKLEAKVLKMIDDLIAHLKASRTALTENEIKAAEDFAVFQSNLFKENRYLAEAIKKLQVHLADLKNQLTRAKNQLVLREKLRKEAEEQLRHLRQVKKEKDDYCARETNRRNNELRDVGSAQSIFQNVLDKLSMRVKLRTQANAQGGKYAAAQRGTNEVTSDQKNIEAGIAARKKVRSDVAYYY